MKKFTISEIINATGCSLIQGNEKDYVLGFSIDSREIDENQMFCTVIGERSNGHDFIKQVVSKGVKNIFVSDLKRTPLEELEGINVLYSEDVVASLHKLSAYYLDTLPLKKRIGVTGSVGKTSTRDMMYYVASTKYKTARNKKNYNSIHGLPLAILEFPEDTEIAVLELGMDAPGEIDRLAQIVKPDIAIITQIAEVNIRKMKNIENIVRAKMEITDYFNEESVLVVNSACPELSKERVSGDYRLLSVDDNGQGDFNVSDIKDYGDKGVSFVFDDGSCRQLVELPTAGAHNAYNAGLAMAVGQLIGISPAEAAEGLKQAELTGKRLNIFEKNGLKIIDDCYNACEKSVKSAINTLAATEAKRRVAILGDVIGLEDRAEAAHRSMGEHVAKKGIDILVAVGEDGFYYADEAKKYMNSDSVMYFAQKEDFIKVKNDIIKDGDVILVKASRGMEMEKIINEL